MLSFETVDLRHFVRYFFYFFFLIDSVHIFGASIYDILKDNILYAIQNSYLSTNYSLGLIKKSRKVCGRNDLRFTNIMDGWLLASKDSSESSSSLYRRFENLYMFKLGMRNNKLPCMALHVVNLKYNRRDT